MRPNTIVLQGGSEIKSDVLFCGTGWSRHYPFFAKEQVIEFGLPHAFEEDSNEASNWGTLLKAADQQVIKQFPQLANPPPYFQRPTTTTATRLYNCIAPLRDDTIAFLGDIYLSNSFRTAEAQAIWVTAYFDGNIKLPPQEEAEKEIAYMTTFSRRNWKLLPYGSCGLHRQANEGCGFGVPSKGTVASFRIPMSCQRFQVYAGGIFVEIRRAGRRRFSREAHRRLPLMPVNGMPSFPRTVSRDFLESLCRL